jgi:hypothetical protein
MKINVNFYTPGEYDVEIKELFHKLKIINKYFPFSEVKGKYNSENSVELDFDNDISINGLINSEPHIVTMKIENKDYEIDIHPYDSMSGFDYITFENSIKRILKQVNSLSLIIEHDGYAVKSISIDKNQLNDFKFIITHSFQIENKLIDPSAIRYNPD